MDSYAFLITGNHGAHRHTRHQGVSAEYSEGHCNQGPVAMARMTSEIIDVDRFVCETVSCFS